MFKQGRGLREDYWGKRCDKPHSGLGFRGAGLANALERALETQIAALNSISNLLCDLEQVASFNLNLESEGL